MSVSTRSLVKSFCIDINSDEIGQPASPGLYAHADAAEHVAWCADWGINVIQTFCVALNGYAWYRSNVTPVTPGMRGDYLKQMIKHARRRDIKTYGYMCLSGNAWYAATHPEVRSNLRLGTDKTDRRKTIALTSRYLDYFCQAAGEAVRENEIDGVLLDWFEAIVPTWFAAERQMFVELMGQAFPGDCHVPVDVEYEFRRRATIRAWRRVHEAIKTANPRCSILINVPFHSTDEAIWVNSPVFEDLDEVMTERCDMTIGRWLKQVMGPQRRVWYCIGGYYYNMPDCEIPWRVLVDEGFDLYAYCRPSAVTTLPCPSQSPQMLERVLPVLRDATGSCPFPRNPIRLL